MEQKKYINKKELSNLSLKFAMVKTAIDKAGFMEEIKNRYPGLDENTLNSIANNIWPQIEKEAGGWLPMLSFDKLISEIKEKKPEYVPILEAADRGDLGPLKKELGVAEEERQEAENNVAGLHSEYQGAVADANDAANGYNNAKTPEEKEQWKEKYDKATERVNDTAKQYQAAKTEYDKSYPSKSESEPFKWSDLIMPGVGALGAYAIGNMLGGKDNGGSIGLLLALIAGGGIYAYQKGLFDKKDDKNDFKPEKIKPLEGNKSQQQAPEETQPAPEETQPAPEEKQPAEKTPEEGNGNYVNDEDSEAVINGTQQPTPIGGSSAAPTPLPENSSSGTSPEPSVQTNINSQAASGTSDVNIFGKGLGIKVPDLQIKGPTNPLTYKPELKAPKIETPKIASFKKFTAKDLYDLYKSKK